jgi:hypothetical protein
MDDMYIKKAKRVVSTCMIKAPLNLGAELLRGGVPMDACGLHPSSSCAPSTTTTTIIIIIINIIAIVYNCCAWVCAHRSH